MRLTGLKPSNVLAMKRAEWSQKVQQGVNGKRVPLAATQGTDLKETLSPHGCSCILLIQFDM